jgi:microcystin-dependent protein
MAEPYIGQITLFGGNFAPRGWAFCNGQLVSIAQYPALFSLLGTTYGGNGQTTFALPDLRGRVPMHPGSGPGLTPKNLGQQGGTETVTLDITQIPAHSHQLNTSTANGSSANPTNNFIAVTHDPNTLNNLNSFAPTANSALGPTAVQQSGGSQPHDNVQPFTCINYIIALEGVFPPRD